MLPYLIIYFSIFAFSCLLCVKSEKYESISYIIYILIIGLFCSLFYIRDFSIGIDTYAYSEIFYDLYFLNNVFDVIDYAIDNNFEIGFIYFSYILSKLFSQSLVFSIYAAIIYFNYIFILKKIKINPIIYFMAFFSYFGVYLWSLNILRQMVAVSFVVLGSYYLAKNKNSVFLLFLTVATFFHYSAIVCIVFLILKRNLNFFYKFRFFLIIITIFLSKILLVLVSSYYDRYYSYATASNMENIGIMLMIFYIFTFLLNDFFGRKIKIYKDYFKFFTVIFSIYIALQFSFLINNISNYGTTRIVIYFLWPSVFIWGIFFKNIKDANVRFLLVTLFVSFLTFYWFLVLKKSSSDIIPFKYFMY
jgi:hypothetical protein